MEGPEGARILILSAWVDGWIDGQMNELSPRSSLLSGLGQTSFKAYLGPEVRW